MPLNEGDEFAGYTILRLLGSGGMGEVYLARHPRLPRRDALKVLPAALTADAEYRQRFSREADIAAELWHPHIVGIHDRGEFDGQLWISMDFVEGTDAAELLRTRYPSGMPKGDVAEIIAAVADALDYAHLRGLLHRDVKPANILLTDADSRGRRIMLADFGIAREIGDISGLTATNMVMGTTAYSAPEQLMGKDIDGRADQYALGCTAFHLLTGAAPYHNSNAAVVITQHLSEPPPQISERRPDLAELNAVFARVLAKDPGYRYRSCSDFASALTGRPSVGAANTVAGQAVTAAPTTLLTAASQSTPPKPRARRLRPAVVISAIAAVLALAVAAVAGVELLGHQGNDSSSATGEMNPPGSGGTTTAAPAIRLTRYITDTSGVLTAADRTAVERAISKLYKERNVHLWVAYVDDFGGLGPARWAQRALRANGFTDTDGLLAIGTATRSYEFRPPAAMTDGTSGTRVNAELIRKNRIAPAVRKAEWTQAAVGAAEGLETAR
jgi:serine/threonine protein kinase, bacterial